MCNLQLPTLLQPARSDKYGSHTSYKATPHDFCSVVEQTLHGLLKARQLGRSSTSIAWCAAYTLGSWTHAEFNERKVADAVEPRGRP